MEVIFAAFELTNYTIPTDAAIGSEIKRDYSRFVDSIKKAFDRYNKPKGFFHPHRLKLIVEGDTIVVWFCSGTPYAWSSLLGFCRFIMSSAFCNHIPIRGYIDVSLVDGKTWISPSFFFERYHVSFSPEVEDALKEAKLMPWCGIHLSRHAASSVEAFRNIPTLYDFDDKLLSYYFRSIRRHVVTLNWLSKDLYTVLPELLHKMHRGTYSRWPNRGISRLTRNTQKFADTIHADS